MQNETDGWMDRRTLLTRRRYLMLAAIAAGASPFLAQEAVSSVALEHDWDMDEVRTWDQWANQHSPEGQAS